MGSVDKAAIVWTIAIVLIGASVAIVGSNFDQADSKQDMKMTGSMNDDMMMQDGKMTDMEKMMDYDRDSSGDKTTEKMMDEKMMDEKMTMKETGPVTKSVSIPSVIFLFCFVRLFQDVKMQNIFNPILFFFNNSFVNVLWTHYEILLELILNFY